nr:PREDICTED: inactive ubiquitin thioesterase FAM105A [Latimeria chalumnae]|eukprot:XP_014347803.1 PREDICTED: inactive ubiquitin thioesterase FAM105A [Latimeria chalumnae]
MATWRELWRITTVVSTEVFANWVDCCRLAYKEIYQTYHIQFVRRVRGDNYCALRATMFQIFSHGINFPSWMKEVDIVKIPEKLMYSHGCNWIQQYSFGSEKYAGPKAFRKLRNCMEILKSQWTDIYAVKDQDKRLEACEILFSDEDKEYKIYEAVKFLMLYLVIEFYEEMKNGRGPPNFCNFLFARDTSLDPLSFMMNHLNTVGDTGGLEQVTFFFFFFLKFLCVNLVLMKGAGLMAPKTEVLFHH